MVIVSTKNGRSKIINAVSIQKDIISTRLNSNECNLQFYYRLNNECYKAYTHIKKFSKLQVQTLFTEQVYQ